MDSRPSRLSTVVFDLGNVLIQWSPRFLYEKLFHDRAEALEWFLRNICTPAWNLECDRGMAWRDAITRLRSRFPEWRPEIEAFDRDWHQMAPGAIGDTVRILESLKRAGIPLYAITNFSAEKFAECRARFPFLDRFDGIVVSAHERMVKPDPAIFQLLFERYGLDAASCIFIDDASANVAAARELGMTALLFTDAAALAGDLRRLGFAV